MPTAFLHDDDTVTPLFEIKPGAIDSLQAELRATIAQHEQHGPEDTGFDKELWGRAAIMMRALLAKMTALEAKLPNGRRLANEAFRAQAISLIEELETRIRKV